MIPGFDAVRRSGELGQQGTPDRSQDSASKNASEDHRVQPPEISLPKGGGAIRGIGEKLAANPVTGTGSMTVPIATSPGRSGFGPQLTFSYDSGAGNGPFGRGWSLGLPQISRKTEKGLPRYNDAGEDISEADVFMLSGAEDLVPVLEKKATGEWKVEELPPRNVDGVTYKVRRYRPRPRNFSPCAFAPAMPMHCRNLAR